ncbi:unnamed protein product [Ambrosiozyma monospora]|uniref:Unnamed protein product n=1 Tax=Ambrosiozyma monospora TaxID=43982 RepID=A0A9W7DJ49_AMBMO|nr:unnamed protein product [Ambrosiozyma monospora]
MNSLLPRSQLLLIVALLSSAAPIADNDALDMAEAIQSSVSANIASISSQIAADNAAMIADSGNAGITVSQSNAIVVHNGSVVTQVNIATTIDDATLTDDSDNFATVTATSAADNNADDGNGVTVSATAGIQIVNGSVVFETQAVTTIAKRDDNVVTQDVTAAPQTIVQTVEATVDLGVTSTAVENVTVTGATITNVQYVTETAEPTTVTVDPVTVTADSVVVTDIEDITQTEGSIVTDQDATQTEASVVTDVQDSTQTEANVVTQTQEAVAASVVTVDAEKRDTDAPDALAAAVSALESAFVALADLQSTTTAIANENGVTVQETHALVMHDGTVVSSTDGTTTYGDATAAPVLATDTVSSNAVHVDDNNDYDDSGVTVSATAGIQVINGSVVSQTAAITTLVKRDAVSTDVVNVTNPAQTIFKTVVDSVDLGATGTAVENVTVIGATVTDVQYVTNVGEPITVTAAPVTVTAAPTIFQANHVIVLDVDSTLSTSYTQAESES